MSIVPGSKKSNTNIGAYIGQSARFCRIFYTRTNTLAILPETVFLGLFACRSHFSFTTVNPVLKDD